MRKIRKTRFQQLHLIITIIAAIIVTAICLYLRADLFMLAVYVSVAIASFYILGQIIRMFLEHALKPTQTETEEVFEGQVFTEDESEMVEGENDVLTNAYAEFDDK